MLDRKKSTRSKYTMAECLSLPPLSIRYPTNIAREKSRIHEMVHYRVSIALKYCYFRSYHFILTTIAD